MERAFRKLKTAPSCAQQCSRSWAVSVRRSYGKTFERAVRRELEAQSLAAVSADRSACKPDADAAPEERGSEKKTSRWSGLLSNPFGMLWKEIICPPRLEYCPEDLGPPRFKLGRHTVEREDLSLFNGRGHRLECSHFRRVGAPAKSPCVVYVHGHGSSRLEAFTVLDALIAQDISVFAFDLSGSGQSGGEYVSLGHYEEQDVRTVLQHLRNSGTNGPVGIWGRSMGASAAVLRAAEDDELAACVLDSAFSNFTAVAREVVQNLRVKVPEFLVELAIRKLRGEIRSRALFDIEDLVPLRRAPQAKTPVLFVTAKDDDFVLPHHTYRLHGAWGGGDKTLVTVGGAHNSLRPPKFLSYAAEFLADRLTNRPASTPKAAKEVYSQMCSQGLAVISQIEAPGGAKPVDFFEEVPAAFFEEVPEEEVPHLATSV